METYRQAQALFARAQHRDGEIGAWRNIGIAYALDLHDSQRALDAFDAALKLARESSNRRGEVLALLYRGETLRRLGRRAEATAELQAALAGATGVGLVEEQWKALYGLGRMAEADGRGEEAGRSYERAIAAIESVRADLQAVALRSEFLADKRDVYDALIALRLSRALGLGGRGVRAHRAEPRAHLAGPPSARRASGCRSTSVQRKIAPGALLLEYWSGAAASAVVWVSSSAAGIARQAASAADLEAVQRFARRRVAAGRRLAHGVGRAPAASCSPGLPDLAGVSRLLVVPDGPLHFVPFEALTVPGAHDLLVDRLEISYLPSAALLVRRPPARARALDVAVAARAAGLRRSAGCRRRPPGTPPPRLSHADDEIRAIADVLPGRAELHLGPDAQKRLLQREPPKVPLLHFATHAIADTRDPDRSRILLAPAAPGGAADHLFLREIYDLDLSGVQLVTLSACETERGKVIRGEGVEGFSRALLAAGAASAVTTRWDVVDRASAEFMKQFYFALAQGQSEASALREAKRQFLHSRLPWSHPRYWAGVRPQRRRSETGCRASCRGASWWARRRWPRSPRRRLSAFQAAPMSRPRSGRGFDGQAGRDRPDPVVDDQAEHLDGQRRE